MVSSWPQKNSLVLGQVKVAEKSNEITAIPTLLSHLNSGHLDIDGELKNILN